MNILLISPYLPYPLFSGGHIRLYNLIKELSKKHKITLICEKRDYQGKKEIEELKKICKKVITVNRRKQWTIGNILKTGLSLSPFLIVGNTSEHMKEEIKRELSKSQFDLIHAETSYIMQNIPPIDIPLILVEHNIEYLVYKRFADNALLPLRPLLYIDVLKLKYWEEKMWKKATKLVAVSQSEKEIMEKIRGDVEIVSNGVDINKYQISNIKNKKEGREKRILFIGEFKWVQNRDAVEWILKEIWPHFIELWRTSRGKPKIKLWMVGRNIPDSIRKMTGDNDVMFDENAPKETEEIYKKSSLLLAPIRVGGGTSFKILEAMASGVPVVTTPLGNAIGALHNLEIVISKTTHEFVQNIKKLFEDKEFYEKISLNGRRLVEEKYNWQKISQDLNSVYESVVPYA